LGRGFLALFAHFFWANHPLWNPGGLPHPVSIKVADEAMPFCLERPSVAKVQNPETDTNTPEPDPYGA
jgi:hypothetical protein